MSVIIFIALCLCSVTASFAAPTASHTDSTGGSLDTTHDLNIVCNQYGKESNPKFVDGKASCSDKDEVLIGIKSNQGSPIEIECAQIKCTYSSDGNLEKKFYRFK
ncbi:hypothetical protein M9194_04315 [Vibrio sp. S4M6]|uniref:hypothetical protein n=1 Tax=Vibrio sinus TaxID=2946865 RepID=UPI00202AA230|nr:hypothetical protein [Vibrio sinus]MCL9780660.1 hypothetical protein [Vibrio sinus]